MDLGRQGRLVITSMVLYNTSLIFLNPGPLGVLHEHRRVVPEDFDPSGSFFKE
jgi:hypothetical protein